MALSPYMPTPANAGWRRLKSTAVTWILFLCAGAAIAPLGLVLYFLISKGASSIDFAFFTQIPKPPGEVGGGMANAIVGTMELLGMAAVFGVPLGVTRRGLNCANVGTSCLCHTDKARSWIARR